MQLRQHLRSHLLRVEWAGLIALIGLVYSGVLRDLFLDCWRDPALSQGLLIPPLALCIAWLRRSRTLAQQAQADNRGLLAVALASVLYLAGRVGAEYFLMRISFIVLLAGMIWTFWGTRRLRSLALPFLLLSTMIPLPKVVYNSLATPLQLLASDVSASIARDLGVTVYREGNVISLAAITLGVEDACSGLTSLSCLLVAGTLLGFLLCTRLPCRALLMGTAIPLAIGVNILRITGTALLADYRPEYAFGFYHSFSGWLVFVLGFFCLYVFAKALHGLLD